MKINLTPALNIASIHSKLLTAFEGRYPVTKEKDTNWLGMETSSELVVVKKSAWVGVSVSINEKKGVVEITGITPSASIDQFFSKNLGLVGVLFKKLFLLSSMKKMEKMVAEVLEK